MVWSLAVTDTIFYASFRSFPTVRRRYGATSRSSGTGFRSCTGTWCCGFGLEAAAAIRRTSLMHEVIADDW